MIDKTTATITLSILTIIGGMVLNFQEFAMGSSATLKNLLVTIIYLAIWILILIIGIKTKERVILKYCSIFWFIMIMVSFLLVYVNATDVIVDWALPFVILLSGQLYGVRFFVVSLLNLSIVVAVISLIMYIAAIISLNRITSLEVHNKF